MACLKKSRYVAGELIRLGADCDKWLGSISLRDLISEVFGSGFVAENL